VAAGHQRPAATQNQWKATSSRAGGSSMRSQVPASPDLEGQDDQRVEEQHPLLPTGQADGDGCLGGSARLTSWTAVA
jgi:hypothetical protein